jgi:hypothetical protein
VTISPEYIRPSKDAFDFRPIWMRRARLAQIGMFQTLVGPPIDLEKGPRVYQQFFQILSLWHKSIEAIAE